MEINTTSIVFTGDIGFDKYMDGKWEDENLLSKPILDFSTALIMSAPM